MPKGSPICRLVCYPKSCGDVVRKIVSTREFTVVIKISGNPLVQDQRSTRSNQETVAANIRTIDRKAIARPVGETCGHRIGGVSEFMLPSRTDLRQYGNVTDFPFVDDFGAESSALRLGVLVRKLQWRQ